MALVVGKAGDVPRGSAVAFQVDGRSIAIANVEGTFYAFDDLCTHRGCSLSEGPLEGAYITCPCHNSMFQVTDGSVVAGPANVALNTYAVAVIGDALHVSVTNDISADLESEPHASPATVIATSDRVGTHNALASVPLFSGLDAASIESLESFTFTKTFAPGEVIVEEGRTGNGLYVVLSGSVEVVKGLGGARPQQAALLGPGEPFGEMALLGDWKRSASVRAVDRVECLGMDRWVFLSHLNKEPRLAIKMLQMLAGRLAETNEKLVE